eukprot:2123823-Lingulodinium_polyedra.AAC.1
MGLRCCPAAPWLACSGCGPGPGGGAGDCRCFGPDVEAGHRGAVASSLDCGRPHGRWQHG